MEKLKFESKDIAQENADKIAAIFPSVVTESRDEQGKLKRAINFDHLRTLLGDELTGDEAYEFTWVGKRKAIREATRPIRKTLRPCPEESKNWDITENLYIEGDNLDVLKLLQESYLGKVKMIYIDPPYNKGNDYIYRDKFAQGREEYEEEAGVYNEEGDRLFRNTDTNGRFHSDWCSMIYPRLMLARNMLAKDGVIVISIDENEATNLRKICDEIFGASNYAGEIVWKNSSKNDQSYISIQHEYFLFYVKSKIDNLGNWLELKEGVDEIFKAFEGFLKKYGNNWIEIHNAALDWYKQFPESNPISSSDHYSWMDERGVYYPDNISGPNFGQYRYDVIHPLTGKICKEPASGWRYPESTMLERIKKGLVHFGDDETTVPNNKTYLADTLNQSLTSIKYKDGRAASKLLTNLMGRNCFTNPKDVSLLIKIMNALNLTEGDIVVDFFAGSSATAEAVMQMSADGVRCRFILVQIQENLDETLKSAIGSTKKIIQNAIDLCNEMGKPHNIAEIGKERIRRAGEKIEAQVKDENRQPKLDGKLKPLPDIGFRVLKLDDSNMKDVYYSADEIKQEHLPFLESNIKEDRTDMDLLFGCLLEWGLPLSMPHTSEIIDGFTVHTYSCGDLIACFEEHISEKVVFEIADRKPLRAVFRDSSFASSPQKINVFEIFKLHASNTTVKVI
ncbi:MAG: site-specific DNA-methyltransferase [Candidatus Gastranaerophilales bacterium]|nr:site-specific DNA-methyltransferase [Candidatus Gastranaerophilales bacterium]